MTKANIINRKSSLLFIVALLMPKSVFSENILDTMTGKIVNEYKNAIINSPMASQFVQSEVTIFAPSDRAIRKYVNEKDDNLLLNHMVNVAINIGDRDSYTEVTRISSMLPGSPPLWLTRSGSDYFINGAEVIMKNLKATSDRGNREQRLHFVDRVLEPLVPVVSSNSQAYLDLTAGKFLRDSTNYKIVGHSIRNFTSQVLYHKKFSIFDKPGTHTFFIPVDSAFHKLDKELIDKNVIAGHVVPDYLLFSRPLSKIEQKTATYTEKDSSIRVTAVIQMLGDTIQVKSNTVQGNRHHSREHVIANIIKSDIPVANGIVHLIDKPLIVVASPLWKYLEEEEQKGGRLSQFTRYINQYGGGLATLIQNAEDGATIFAPSNEAFDPINKAKLEMILSNPDEGPRLLGLHFINQRISADDIRIHQPQNEIKMFGARIPFPETSSDQIWFYYKSNNETLMLDGMGVTAEVVEPDIGTTNGVIHVINKVLGFPIHTIEEKLSLDPMTTSVYSLGQQNHFNQKFQRTDQKYTYLVPSDKAWRKLNRSFATVYKILFMGDFAYQTAAMLERHLKIGEPLSEDDLIEKTTMDGGVSMLRGDPMLRFTREVDDINGNYTVVQWEDIKAKIIRPNLECVNGYIHIIDTVIMKRRDVTVSSLAPKFCAICSSYPILAIVLLSQWFA